jgi:hypothetical protein
VAQIAFASDVPQGVRDRLEPALQHACDGFSELTPLRVGMDRYLDDGETFRVSIPSIDPRPGVWESMAGKDPEAAAAWVRRTLTSRFGTRSRKA